MCFRASDIVGLCLSVAVRKEEISDGNIDRGGTNDNRCHGLSQPRLLGLHSGLYDVGQSVYPGGFQHPIHIHFRTVSYSYQVLYEEAQVVQN